MKPVRFTLLTAAATIGLGHAAAFGDPVGTAFTYQGELQQGGGPAAGTFVIDFSLFDVEAGGTQIGSETQNITPDANGRFTTTLDFQVDPYTTNEALWLEIWVDGSMLSPRQELTPTPFSLATRGVNVDADGNVGIGTTSPIAALQIDTDTVFDLSSTPSGQDNLLITDNVAGGQGNVFGSIGFGNNESSRRAAIAAMQTGGDPDLQGFAFYTHPSSVAGNDLVESMRISANGMVGIGVIPEGKLHVRGDQIRVDDYGTPSNIIGARANGTFAAPTALAQGNVITRFNARGHTGTGFSANREALEVVAAEDWSDVAQGTLLRLNTTQTGTTTDFERMRIDPNGNVGVGTTTPEERLDVAGNLKFSADTPRILGGTGSRPLNLYENTTATNSHTWIELWGDHAGGDRDGELALAGTYVDLRYNSTTTGSGNVGVRLDQNGKVGIGTDEPSSKLHVKGTSTTILMVEAGSNNPVVRLTDDAATSSQDWTLRMNTGDADKFQIVHDGDQHVTVTPGGSVGIRTSAPSAALQVGDGVSTANASIPNGGLCVDTDGTCGTLGGIRVGTGGILGTDSSGDDVLIVPTGSGRIGIGTDSPLAKMHIETTNILLSPDALVSGERLVIESTNAGMALYSDQAGSYGSFLSMGEVDDTGALVDKWSFARRTTSGGSDLRLLYGPNSTPSTNDMIMTFGDDGNVGIGTTSPGNERLKVAASSDFAAIWAENTGQGFAGVFRNTTGVGTALFVEHQGTGSVIQGKAGSSVVFDVRQDGTTSVEVLEITGADLAEKFPVSEEVTPGMVMEIDPDRSGHLRVARGAYNRRVAGVVSGANDLPAGAILGNLPGSEDAPPIALSGRVWTWCHTSGDPIQPGDLLTTSDTPGYAMKVTQHDEAQGAIIGKAMTALENGRGLVLVLVTLQ